MVLFTILFEKLRPRIHNRTPDIAEYALPQSLDRFDIELILLLGDSGRIVGSK